MVEVSTAIVMDSVAETPKLSVTITPIGKKPGDVGVPDSVPPGLKLKPGGIPCVGSTAKLYGALPPEPRNDTKYGVPTLPFDRKSGVMARGVTLT